MQGRQGCRRIISSKLRKIDKLVGLVPKANAQRDTKPMLHHQTRQAGAHERAQARRAIRSHHARLNMPKLKTRLRLARPHHLTRLPPSNEQEHKNKPANQ